MSDILDILERQEGGTVVVYKEVALPPKLQDHCTRCLRGELFPFNRSPDNRKLYVQQLLDEYVEAFTLADKVIKAIDTINQWSIIPVGIKHL